ncbi:uncharacterized protein LOC129968409 [Argiope bruennichi]|uniref:uncharacterized protein LOC129968409 n=1 Tax=Argiope bruennichi TaxID=94029 RepID=UPI0024957041|nr:uncharacterized protein LOC129968409 [Argiope bruennichi]
MALPVYSNTGGPLAKTWRGRWKTATVVPIHKPGKDPTDPTNYRPISLLPSIKRKSEIQERIEKYEESLELITTGEDIQKGKMHSTSNTAIVHTNPQPPVQALTTNKADSEAQIDKEKMEVEIHQDPQATKNNAKKPPKINAVQKNNPAIFKGDEQITVLDGENDEGFQTQKLRNKHKRRLSDENRSGKKHLIEKKYSNRNKNKFSPLQNMQDQTIGPNIPPIVFKKTNSYQAIIKRLNETHNISCKAKPSGEFLHLYCESTEDHRRIKNYFEEEKIEYYVISSRIEKPTKIVIKGLPIDTPCEKIKNELIKKGYRVVRVNQFKQFKTKQHLPIFQVHLYKSDNLQNIYNEDTLCYMISRIEKYIRKTVGQCFKCQSFAHVSQNCRMQERCVIWAENHDSRNCPQKKAETVKKKCANCGGPHTASYRGCPKFPKLNINRNGEIQQGKSFASLFKKSNIPPTSAPSKAPAMSTPPNATEPPIQLSKNNQEFEDTFKLLNHLKTITVAIPNLKEILQKLYKEKNPLNKLFNLAEAFSPTSV